MIKYYVLAIIAILIGINITYKNTISFDSMTQISGKIYDKKIIEYGKSWRIFGTYYSLAFTTDKVNYKLGISLGHSYNQSYCDSLSDLFESNKIYTFYLNPLISRGTNLWDGVEKIEYNGNILYQSDREMGIIYGLGIIVITLIGIVYLAIKYDPIKDNNFWSNFGKRGNNQLRDP